MIRNKARQDRFDDQATRGRKNNAAIDHRFDFSVDI